MEHFWWLLLQNYGFSFVGLFEDLDVFYKVRNVIIKAPESFQLNTVKRYS